LGLKGAVEREALRVSERPRAEEESKETSAAAAATPSDKEQHVAYEDSQTDACLPKCHGVETQGAASCAPPSSSRTTEQVRRCTANELIDVIEDYDKS